MPKKEKKLIHKALVLLDADATVYGRSYLNTCQDLRMLLINHLYGPALLEQEDLYSIQIEAILQKVKEITTQPLAQVLQKLYAAWDKDQEKLYKDCHTTSEKKDWLIAKYWPLIADLDEDVYHVAVVAGNQVLLDDICKRVIESKKPIDVLELAFGSSRGSAILDQTGSEENKTGSFYKDLYYLADAVTRRLPNIKIHLITHTLLDWQHELPPGTHFKSMLVEKNVIDPPVNYQNTSELTYSYYEEDKVLLTLFHAYRAMNENTASLQIWFYEDLTRILLGLFAKYDQYPKLLPPNTSFEFLRYIGTDTVTVYGRVESVPESRRVNDLYATLSSLVEHCGLTFFPGLSTATTFSALKKLDVETFLIERDLLEVGDSATEEEDALTASSSSSSSSTSPSATLAVTAAASSSAMIAPMSFFYQSTINPETPRFASAPTLR